MIALYTTIAVRLSGAEIIATLARFRFVVHAQRGSHAKLRHVLVDGTVQTLTVPVHGELDTGTCRAILRQAPRFVSELELRPHFYTD
jgi:predicted RNA binding protein YcfA (HicA-like mRNA interferase family)